MNHLKTITRALALALALVACMGVQSCEDCTSDNWTSEGVCITAAGDYCQKNPGTAECDTLLIQQPGVTSEPD